MLDRSEVVCPVTGVLCGQDCVLPKIPDVIKLLDGISMDLFHVPMKDRLQRETPKARQTILEAVATDLSKRGITFVCPREEKSL